MSDNKKTSLRKCETILNDQASNKQKANSLTQEIKKLTAQLEQKEQELLALASQKNLIEDLSHKIQETEKAIQTKLQGKKGEPRTSLEEKSEPTAATDKLSKKLEEVEIELASTSILNTHTQAQNTVKTHMIAGMSLGLLPIPLLDIAALSAIQLNLLRSLSKHYSVDFDEKTGKAVLTSLLSGAIPVMSIVGLSSLTKLIPGIGTIGGNISMTALTGSVVYATGQVFIRHFESGGTFQNFESKHWQAFFKKQITVGKSSIHR